MKIMAHTTGVRRHQGTSVTCRRRRGFTITEVLITSVIIGMLAALAIPRYIFARDNARKQQAEADLALLSTAIEELAWDTGMWPGGIDRAGPNSGPEYWDLRTADVGLLETDGDFDNWQGPYVAGIPTDPWGNPYFFDLDYRHKGNMRVAVGSFGPNGKGRNYYDEDNIYVLLDE